MCACGSNLTVLWLCTSELDQSESIHLLKESTSPFIDEGDSLTRERDRVRMLLNLVAHVVGYKTIVGAHNTVDVRCMWEIASSSSGMADVGACHTVDA